MKKYGFTGKTIKRGRITLRQIIRLSDNKIGGYIQYDLNLGHKGSCFVYDNAMVFGKARVTEDAEVRENAKVYGKSIIKGKARIFGNATVLDTKVIDNATISGKSLVCSNDCIDGVCEITGDDRVGGKLLNFVDPCEFTITASKHDDYIRVGCKKHSVLEWVSYIESGEDFYLEECENEIEYYRCISMIQHIIYLFETMD